MNQFVVCIAVDSFSREAVYLVKQKGPSFLKNKITFPGGRIEAEENPQQAASREFLEEAGVFFDPTQWKMLFSTASADREVYFMYVLDSKALNSKPQENEEEKVFISNFDFHLAQSERQPQVYAPDFLQTCQKLAPVLKRHHG